MGWVCPWLYLVKLGWQKGQEDSTFKAKITETPFNFVIYFFPTCEYDAHLSSESKETGNFSSSFFLSLGMEVRTLNKMNETARKVSISQVSCSFCSTKS